MTIRRCPHAATCQISRKPIGFSCLGRSKTPALPPGSELPHPQECVVELFQSFFAHLPGSAECASDGRAKMEKTTLAKHYPWAPTAPPGVLGVVEKGELQHENQDCFFAFRRRSSLYRVGCFCTIGQAVRGRFRVRRPS